MLPFFFSVLHSLSGWEEERQSGDSDSGEYRKGRLQKTSSFTGEMKEYIGRRVQQSREKGGSKPLSYLCSNRKIIVDDFREVMLLLESTGRKCIFPYLPWRGIAVFFMIFPFNSRRGSHVEKGELRGEGVAVAGEKAGMAADAGKMEFRLGGRYVCAIKYASGILTDGIRGSLRA